MTSDPDNPLDAKLAAALEAGTHLAGRMVDPSFDLARDAGPPPDQTGTALEHKRWAVELGVKPEVLDVLIAHRHAIVADVAAEPRMWGFDLPAKGSFPRDAIAEFRARTRMGGYLAQSFITGYAPLLDLAADPLSLPSGVPVDVVLQVEANLDEAVAVEIAAHLRSIVQERLGRPLDVEAVSRAVREVTWDHEMDAARVEELVLAALSTVV